jgi:hypothetical protein
MQSTTSDNQPPPIVVGNNISNNTTHPVSITSPNRAPQRPRVNSYSINVPPVACQAFSPVPDVTQTQETFDLPTEVEVPNRTPAPPPTPRNPPMRTRTPNPVPTPTHPPTPVPNVTDTSTRLVLLHHEDESHYVFSKYCLSVDETLASNCNDCKFGKRNCVVHRSSLLEHGQQLTSLSKTVFSPNPKHMKKNTYSILDSRLVFCSNPNCTDKSTSQSKSFHYVCYRHFLSMKENQKMKVIELSVSDDNLFSHLKDGNDIKSLVASIANDDIKLILPVCSKSCYNKVTGFRVTKKKDNVLVSSDGTLFNWDKDGGNGKPSSTEILVNWLTTEENASSYYGGVDRRGKTNANRKEQYHKLIAMLIHKTNGKFGYVHKLNIT